MIVIVKILEDPVILIVTVLDDSVIVIVKVLDAPCDGNSNSTR